MTLRVVFERASREPERVIRHAAARFIASGSSSHPGLIARRWADIQNYISLTKGGNYDSKVPGERLVPGKFYDLTSTSSPLTSLCQPLELLHTTGRGGWAAYRPSGATRPRIATPVLNERLRGSTFGNCAHAK